MKMKKTSGSSTNSGIAATLMLVVVIVESFSNLQVATAQASCLSVAGAGAPFSDAANAINQLRTTPGQCCQQNCGGFFTLMLTSGDAALTIGGGCGFCLSCADAGNFLNIALSQCNVQNQVEAAYAINGDSSQILYITNVEQRPQG